MPTETPSGGGGRRLPKKPFDTGPLASSLPSSAEPRMKERGKRLGYLPQEASSLMEETQFLSIGTPL